MPSSRRYSVRVEEVVGRVRHERLMPTSAGEAQPVDGATPPWVFSRWTKVVVRQRVATGGSVLGSNHLEQEPGNRTLLDEVGGPVEDGRPPWPRWCSCPGVLPRGANRALDLRRDRLRLGLKKWVMICLSSSLNRVASGVKSAKATPARARGQADVVLGADGVTHEERLVPRWHLNVVGHGWRCDMVGVGRLRQRDHESHGESSGARDEQDATGGPILQCIAVLHTIFLSRLVRGLGVLAARSGWGPIARSGSRPAHREAPVERRRCRVIDDVSANA